jgi:uncharacterized protein (DUF1499 family)
VETRSRVAFAAAWFGWLGLGLAALGPATIHWAGARPMTGFLIFQVGLLSGLVALVLGAIGIARTRAGSGRSGRGRALVGALLGALLLAAVVVANGPGLGVPPINDITTNPDDPPVFVGASKLPGNRGRNLDYPGAEFAEAQRGAYTDLEPIEVDASVAATFARSRKAAQDLGWVLIREDAVGGTLEATDTSRLFGFVDDVVVRIRPRGLAGAVVDVRSKSRDGRGDIGANAERIRAFREALLGGTG